MIETSNIVLIGMPGAGKSTLGVVLAKIMGKNFIDADLVIQSQQGTTLQKLIDALGSELFIEIENDALCGISATNTVISTGGSAVYSAEAMEYLSSIGTVVYLEVSPEELEERLGSLHERGVVTRSSGSVSLAQLYEERKPLYEAYAEVTVAIDGLSIREAATKLVDKLSLM